MSERKFRKVVVVEEWYLLTGDFNQALILNQFNWYQLSTKNIDDYIRQENERSKIHDISEGYIQPADGWFYKSLEELCYELMLPFKKSKAHELIAELVQKGWVMIRDNPIKKWDKVKQYRLDLVKIHRDMADMGLTVPEWDLRHLNLRKRSSVEKLSISAARSPGFSERRAIPEYTTEGTTEESLPKSLSAERDLNSSSPEIPPAQVTEEEKTEDPGAARFAKIFEKTSDSTPETDVRLARKFRKAREGGLTDKALGLLSEGYWKASDADWRVRDPFVLLDRLRLGRAVEACGLYVREMLSDERSYLNDRECMATVKSLLGTVSRMSGTEEEWREISSEDYRIAVLVLGASKGYDLTGLREKFRESVSNSLATNPAWLKMAREQKWNCVALFGFTEDEIQGLLDADAAPHQQEIERLQSLL